MDIIFSWTHSQGSRTLKRTSRLVAIVMLAPISLLLAQHANVKQKAAPSSKADKVPQKTWIFHEAKDPMTDLISHTVFLYGSSLTESGNTDREPFLFVTCDPDKPRKLFINLGVLTEDAHPMIRFDQEPATSEHWFTNGENTDRAFYKDDAVGLVGPLHDPKMQSVREIVNGAENFVKEMSEHTTLLVKSNVFDSGPKTVSFNLTGLAALLSAHGCPVKP